MFLVYKYTQFKKNGETAKSKAERELHSLNHKIDKLLLKLEDVQPERFKPGDDECVVCFCASATMKTLPCGHKVVCRMCFVKTIQVAVKERCLPLKCVVCREKIIQLVPSREMLPLTPPPSRRHIKFPWQPENQSASSASVQDCDIKKASLSGPYNVVATRLMQPWLLYPDRQNRCSRVTFKANVSCNDSGLGVEPCGALSDHCRKKRVCFSSPVRNESPSRKPLAGCGTPRKILKNTTPTRIAGTLKYSECFSPRLARPPRARNL